MNTRNLPLFALLCALSLPPRAEAQAKEYAVGGGCIVRARAYIDKAYRPRDASRFDLEVVRTPPNSYSWDLTLPESPNYDYRSDIRAISPTPYGHRKEMTLRATLHQYDTHEERVTFKDLDLGPFPSPADIRAGVTPRSLVLKAPMTATTPSGITITLPAQGADTLDKVFSGAFEGNANALFMQIRTSPDMPLSALPDSPLFQKHHKPVRIKLECPEPSFMVWYMADNTFKVIAVGLPDLKTITHLDTFTLIVRQRVDLQAIPVALTVPISRGER